MDLADKIIPFAAAPELFRRLRAEGKTLVQCHGTFDLVHPGHVIHFEEAHKLGDVLVVTITGEKHVNKGPGRPYFNDALRVKALAAIGYVDYVVVIPYPAAVEAIECVRPDVYCKGREYENPAVDVTGNIQDDVQTVERLGGKVCYVGSVVFSSTRLLNEHFEVYPPEVKTFCRQLARETTASQLRDCVDRFSQLKVLVIGEIIFDRYSTVKVQGLTSKNRMISGRFLNDDWQAGGALAVFRHVKEFTPNVKILSLVGVEPWVEGELAKYVHPDEDLILRIPEFVTIVKQRFVEPMQEGKELWKLFSVNYLNGQVPGPAVQAQVGRRLADCIDQFDVVMVMDFGHGLMSEPVRQMVQERARFMALNCQTNSNNFGFNLINRRYTRTDSFSLDENEICLASGRRQLEFEGELRQLQQFFKARYCWLTRGNIETIGLCQDAVSKCPPLEVQVVDTIGAGDAFTSVASLAAASGLPINVATFLGQLAGAQAVRIVGNSECIKKARLLKSCEAMLNFG